jgi:hypothetical protein
MMKCITDGATCNTAMVIAEDNDHGARYDETNRDDDRSNWQEQVLTTANFFPFTTLS